MINRDNIDYSLWDADYDYEVLEELLDFARDSLEGVPPENLTEDDWIEVLQSFSIPDRDEWISNRLMDEVYAYEDYKYEEMREKEMGL